jgi:nucleotide-binding universal stress UspA family protein
MNPSKILVPVDFSPSSDAALDYALTVADACGAEVEMLYVWTPRDHEDETARTIFADTPEGKAMEQRLSDAESVHPARLCGRLEFGAEPASVILGILERERFDMVVVARVTAGVVEGAPRKCKVITVPPPAPGETEAA